MSYKDKVIEKITQLSKEQVSKVLIFMAGMEAGYNIKEQEKVNESNTLHTEN